MSKASDRDHTIAMVTRVVVGAAAIAAALIAVQQLPHLYRYLKIERI